MASPSPLSYGRYAHVGKSHHLLVCWPTILVCWPTIDPDISIKQQREISAANPSQSVLCSTRITVAKVLICTVLRPAPGSDERNISKSSVAPTGGHVFVKMKAPATLISRVTPFPDNLFRCGASQVNIASAVRR